jgi:hypothetical protein
MDYDQKGRVFHTVEEYAQHIADNYGFTKPDARIYYGDGRIVEINSKRSRT